MSYILYTGGSLLIGLVTLICIKQEKYWFGLVQLFSFYHNKHHETVLDSIVHTVKTITWILYLCIYQRITRNIVWVNKNEFDVHYVFADKLYKLRIKTKRGPCRGPQVLQAINEKDEDITEHILPYIGPYNDWHGLGYTPKDFNAEQITFNLNNGNVVSFKNSGDILSI